MRSRQKGMTLIELIVIIIIVGFLGTIAMIKYLSFEKAAEQGAFNAVLGSLRSALSLYSAKQIVNNQTIVVHNPFDDLATRPTNYAGSFPDVDTSNCPTGFWAYQSGASANGNWAVLCYRPKSTLQQAYVWGGVQWIAFEVTPITDPISGKTIGLTLPYSTAIISPVW